MDDRLLYALCALTTLTKLAKVNIHQASSYPIMVWPSPLDIWNLNIHTGFTSRYVMLVEANRCVPAPAHSSTTSRIQSDDSVFNKRLLESSHVKIFNYNPKMWSEINTFIFIYKKHTYKGITDDIFHLFLTTNQFIEKVMDRLKMKSLVEDVVFCTPCYFSGYFERVSAVWGLNLLITLILNILIDVLLQLPDQLLVHLRV